jgi:chemotaxis protein MotA
MKTHFHEMHEPQHALQNLADALPALGIVAAVLGVVKTMGSIDKPPSILGGMIGSALVGTFMGVLLAYGIVAPMAGRLKQVIEADEQIFHAVKQVIIASLHGWPQPLVVESARSGLGHSFRPGLSELLDSLRGR